GHGRRDPRRRDRRHRRAVGAHRPPRLHHRPRQQRRRRSGPLPEHEGRSLQLRLGAQLRPGAAAGAENLRLLPPRGHLSGLLHHRVRSRPEGVPRHEIRGRLGLHRLQRHRLSRPRRDLGTSRPLRPYPDHDSRPSSGLGDQESRERRRNAVPPRISAPQSNDRTDHVARDQQGHLRGVMMARSFPPDVVVLDSDSLVHARVGRGRKEMQILQAKRYPLRDDVFASGVVTPELRNEALLSDTIRRMKQETGRWDKVSLLLPDSWFRMNIIELQSLPERANEAAEVIRWSLRRTMPVDPSELRLSYEVLSRTPPRILAVSAVDATISAIERQFEAAGIEVVLIEPAGLNVWNAI